MSNFRLPCERSQATKAFLILGGHWLPVASTHLPSETTEEGNSLIYHSLLDFCGSPWKFLSIALEFNKCRLFYQWRDEQLKVFQRPAEHRKVGLYSSACLCSTSSLLIADASGFLDASLPSHSWKLHIESCPLHCSMALVGRIPHLWPKVRPSDSHFLLSFEFYSWL